MQMTKILVLNATLAAVSTTLAALTIANGTPSNLRIVTAVVFTLVAIKVALKGDGKRV
jgi:hypothetical protein